MYGQKIDIDNLSHSLHRRKVVILDLSALRAIRKRIKDSLGSARCFNYSQLLNLLFYTPRRGTKAIKWKFRAPKGT